MSRGYGTTPGSANEPWRLFVAIRLPMPVSAAIDDATSALRRVERVRWASPDDLHMTLAFLGGVGADRVREISELLGASAARRPPLELTLAGVGAFPTVHRARVVWVGVERAHPLLALHADLAGALRRVGFEPDRRKYHPHVTIGRVSREGPPPDLARAIGSTDVDASWRAPGMSLMRSELGRGGARHTEIAAYPFSRGEGRAESTAGG